MSEMVVVNEQGLNAMRHGNGVKQCVRVMSIDKVVEHLSLYILELDVL